MSYQVLARKWRPKGFEEVVGQDHVVRALSNAIQQDRLHHAYMFTGTRGVGKTTLARILAKCLNCETGMTTTPCEQCEACLAVNEGRFVDLIEVDGASRTKVEDTRELLDNVQYAPVQGRIKIYLIDEVHMLSNHSFNALLKTLEEPPVHVKFLLATTDPQKVPITILSRCLQFTLKQLTPEMISDHLAKVLTAESVQFETSALLALGKAARGSARDALSLTDQAIAYGGGHITQAQVQSMLGTVHQQALEQVLRALSGKDPATVLQVVEVLVRDGIDIQQLVQDLLGALHRLSLAKSVPAMLNQADEADQSWLRLAQSFSAEALQVYYQIALLGLRDLSWAPDMRAAVEMLLLRMMLFDLQDPSNASEVPNTDFPAQGQLTDVLTETAPAVMPSASSSETNSDPQINPDPEHVLPVYDGASLPIDQVQLLSAQPPIAGEGGQPQASLVPQSEQATSQSEQIAQNEQTVENYIPETTQQVLQSEGGCAETQRSAEAQMLSPAEPTKRDQLPTPEGLAPWLALIEQAQHCEQGLTGPALNLARNCVITQHEESFLHLSIVPSLRMLMTDNALQRLRDALIGLPQSDIKQVKIHVGEQRGCTPAQWIEQQAAFALENAHKALQADTFIQAIQSTFSATIVPESVKPIAQDVAVLATKKDVRLIDAEDRSENHQPIMA